MPPVVYDSVNHNPKETVMEILAAIIVSLTIGALLGVVFSQGRARVALWRDLGQIWAWMVTPVFADLPDEYVGKHRTVEDVPVAAEFGLGVR